MSVLGKYGTSTIGPGNWLQLNAGALHVTSFFTLDTYPSAFDGNNDGNVGELELVNANNPSTFPALFMIMSTVPCLFRHLRLHPTMQSDPLAIQGQPIVTSLIDTILTTDYAMNAVDAAGYRPLYRKNTTLISALSGGSVRRPFLVVDETDVGHPLQANTYFPVLVSEPADLWFAVSGHDSDQVANIANGKFYWTAVHSNTGPYIYGSV